MDDAIEVRDLVVDRGGRRVLHGISCAVPRGSVTGLLGPSGSGKTTLMRAVVGVQMVSGGHGHRARPTGRLAAAAPPGRLPDPGAERLRRPDRPGERPLLRRPVRAWARRGRPGDRRRRPGRRRRPAGRHPLRRPAQPGLAGLRAGRRAELLVLDEPTVGQDPVLRADLWARFHALAAAGTTLLVSSHVMDEAARCDRLLLIREGAADRRRHPGRDPRRRRRRRPGRGVPAPDPGRRGRVRPAPTRQPHGRQHEPANPRRHHRPHPAPAPARPADHRAARGGAGRAAHPALLHVRRPADPARPADDLRPDRADHARHLPVRDHVPGDQHRHAAGTHLRHAGAAAHHPAGQARPALRVRHRVRAGRRRAGRGRRRAWRTGSSVWRPPAASGW